MIKVGSELPIQGTNV